MSMTTTHEQVARGPGVGSLLFNEKSVDGVIIILKSDLVKLKICFFADEILKNLTRENSYKSLMIIQSMWRKEGFICKVNIIRDIQIA